MSTRIELGFCRPDQPGNLGAGIRLAACLGVTLHVIEPCGFPLDDRRMRRAGLDYAERADLVRHAELKRFAEDARARGRRLVLLNAERGEPHHRFRFQPTDTLLVGPEAGPVPNDLLDNADALVTIPMRVGARSLNAVVAASIVLAEALRQGGELDRLVEAAARGEGR